MTAPTHALSKLEQARIAAVQAVVASEMGLQRHYPIADVLEEHPIFSPGHGLVVSLSMLAPLLDTATVTGWLERHPRSLREQVGSWTLGHLLPGNHPGGVWSALLPGWLLGCRQIARPSNRLQAYTANLAAQVAQHSSAGKTTPTALVDVRNWDHRAADSAQSLAAFLQACDVVTVQGSDWTADSIQAAWAALPEKKRPRLIAFTGRLSIAAVDCVAAADRINSAADAAMFLAMGEQKGCLCPHGAMLVGPEKMRAAWLERLAIAFTELDDLDNPSAPEEALAVAYQHRVYSELARAKTAGFAVRELGPGGKSGRLWQVPLSEPPLPLTGRSYSIWQAETSAQAAQAIAAWNTPLQAIGCVSGAAAQDPSAAGSATSAMADSALAPAFSKVGAWVTRIEQLHSPPVDWPQDGCDLLTRLIQAGSLRYKKKLQAVTRRAVAAG